MTSPRRSLLLLALTLVTTRAAALSPYEKRALDDTLAALGRTVDDAPEGKPIEGVDVVSLPVIDAYDPAPAWVNVLHATTIDEVIRREVLEGPGDPYRQDLCDETARNLRKIPQLSLVLCVPTRGATGDTVRMLVLTKDVWSLRLAWDVVFSTDAGLEYLLLQPSETNLAGSQKTVLARYVYYPASQGFGLGYQVPRLEGTRIATVADMNAFVNTGSGSVEASAGRFWAGPPLYATSATSSWASQTSYYYGRYRQYQGRDVKTSHDIPIEYQRREVVDSVSWTRSLGDERKHDFTFGAEMNVHAYRAENGTGATRANFDAFVRDALPVSETRVGPFVQYRTYSTRYTRSWDLETLGLEENLRLGPELTVRLYPVTRALGSTHDFLGTDATAMYSAALGDGFFRAGVESIVEASKDEIRNGSLDARVHVASPGFGLGRFVLDMEALDRYENELNRISYLGGDGRLRGYPTNALSGRSVCVGNLELRTFPVRLWSLELGGVLFYDVGDAVQDFDALDPKSTVGGGVRILFPMFDRAVFRIDVGVPLEKTPYAPVAVIATFDQAFTMPGTSAASSSLGPSTGWLGQ